MSVYSRWLPPPFRRTWKSLNASQRLSIKPGCQFLSRAACWSAAEFKNGLLMNLPQHLILVFLSSLLAVCLHAPTRAQVAGRSGTDDLVIAQNGRTEATIVAVADPGTWEGRAVADLQKYIGLMSGARPRISPAIPGASAPVLLVGRAALQADPTLRNALEAVATRNPTVPWQAVVVRRARNRIHRPCNNDESRSF